MSARAAMVRLAAARLLSCTTALFALASANAAPLTVTAANSDGNLIYDLTLSSKGLITAITTPTINTSKDAGTRGMFDALVWVPNSYTGTLDLLVADSAKGQIVRYSGPSYGTGTAIYTWSKTAPGPGNPNGLSFDTAGDLFVVQSKWTFQTSPGVWVLPFNPKTGNYGAPVLIDDSFGGVVTGLLGDTVVANTATNLWGVGDLLVLVSDPFDARVLRYSQAAIAPFLCSVLPTDPTYPCKAPPTSLKGPTSTVVPWGEFQLMAALPVGMDVWLDASFGTTLLFTTVDGRILRFEASKQAFVSNFASSLGSGLEKIKVASYANTPYAFVAQQLPKEAGQILQFGAPPTSGANNAVAKVPTGADTLPVGVAVTTSVSCTAGSLINGTCQVILPTTISLPSNESTLPGNVLQTACVVQSDPRVTVTTNPAHWSCTNTTLDISTLCPGFPSTMLPGSACGHAGPTGAGFVVVESTANGVDVNANGAFIQTEAVVQTLLPSTTYDLLCPNTLPAGSAQGPLPLALWAPRSDLPTVEGSIPEDAATPKTFIDLTGFCDNTGQGVRGSSMFAYGLQLNTAALGTAGVPGYVESMYTNLGNTVTENPTGIINSNTASNLTSMINTSEMYFMGGLPPGGTANGLTCALNWDYQTDLYVRAQASAGAFTSTLVTTGSGGGNPNIPGDLDGRLAAIDLYTSTPIAGNPAYGIWPPTSVPPCVTLTETPATVLSGFPATLSWETWGATAGSCVLNVTGGSISGGTETGSCGAQPMWSPIAGSGSPACATSGPLTAVGSTANTPYTATLSCTGMGGAPGQATANATVIPLTGISVAPTPASVPSWIIVPGTQQFAATGTYLGGTTMPLTSSQVNWSSSSSAATISGNGLATCQSPGVANIAATANSTTSTVGISNSAPLTCVTLMGISLVPSTSPPAIEYNTTTSFSVLGTYTDGSMPYFTQTIASGISWASSVPAVASVSSSGVVTGVSGAVSLGQATQITASYVFGGTTFSTPPETVNVLTPVLSLSASVASVPSGQFAMLTWSVTNLPSGTLCTLSASDGSYAGATIPNVAAPGGVVSTGTLNTTGTYTTTLSCPGGGTQVQAMLDVTAMTLTVLPQAALNNPNGLAFASNGNLYVANSAGGQVLVYSANLSGQLEQQPQLTITAGLVNPVRLAFDPYGDLYVADIGTNSVLVFDPMGKPIPSATISVSQPYGVAVDNNGVVYVATAGYLDVFSYAAPGTTAEVTGSPTLGNSWTGDSTGLTFKTPDALAYNGNDIAVADSTVGTVTFYSPAALTGALPLNQDTSSQPPSSYTAPSAITAPGATGVAFDKYGNIYVSEMSSPFVVQCNQSGGTCAPGNLPLTASPVIASPEGVAVDTNGNLYVSSSGTNAVNVYTTLAESGVVTAGLFEYALAPTVTISATPPPNASVGAGNTVTLSYTSAGVPTGGLCTFTDNAGSNNSGLPLQGTQVSPVLTSASANPYTASIVCVNGAVTTPTALVSIAIVPQPTILGFGIGNGGCLSGSCALTWTNGASATACTLTGSDGFNNPSETVNSTDTDNGFTVGTTYTLTCSGAAPTTPVTAYLQPPAPPAPHE
jgi:sugar lactone lactonase YvrE